jgi:c-di-GMP-binding flagellar brake protein YcgR
MTASFEYERREYIRLPLTVPVNYKFLSHAVADPAIDAVHAGSCRNIGTGGLLLQAKLPNPDWLALLLTRTMHIGVNIRLPGQARPVKALCRVAWTSAMETDGALVIGLAFQEIAQEDRDAVTRYIIKAQMPS